MAIEEVNKVKELFPQGEIKERRSMGREWKGVG